MSGMSPASLFFPTVREPDEVLDYRFDMSGPLTDVADTVASVSIAVSPSGVGELVPSALSVAGSVATFWLSGGVPGRWYVVRIECTTAGGRTFEWLPRVLIDPELGSYPAPVAPDPGFGPALTWSPFASLDFSAADNSALLLLV